MTHLLGPALRLPGGPAGVLRAARAHQGHTPELGPSIRGSTADNHQPAGFPATSGGIGTDVVHIKMSSSSREATTKITGLCYVWCQTRTWVHMYGTMYLVLMEICSTYGIQVGCACSHLVDQHALGPQVSAGLSMLSLLCVLPSTHSPPRHWTSTCRGLCSR